MGRCHQGQLRMEQLSYENEYKEIYKVLYNCFEDYPTNIVPKTLNDVILAILQDFPEMFWFEGKWKYEINSESRKCFHPIYNMDRKQIENAKIELSSLIKHLDKEFKNGAKINVAAGLYQWIAQNVEYGSDLGDGQNVYDALIKRKAVCKGIAKAYQLLLLRYGIFCTLAAGSLDGVGRHIWNVIEIDDTFYNVDVCMEYKQLDHLFGKGTRTSYKGFMLSDRQIADTHLWENNYPYRIKCFCEVDDHEFI